MNFLERQVEAIVIELLSICDGSNWPEEAQSGIGFRLYTDLTDRLHEIADELRGALLYKKGVDNAELPYSSDERSST